MFMKEVDESVGTDIDALLADAAAEMTEARRGWPEEMCICDRDMMLAFQVHVP